MVKFNKKCQKKYTENIELHSLFKILPTEQWFNMLKKKNQRKC